MAKFFSAIILTMAAGLLLLGCNDRPPPSPVHSLDDVNGRVIGAMAGTPSERLANELGTARSFFSSDEMIFHLATGTLDCVIIEATVASELLENTSGIRMLGEPILVYDLRFAVALENRELLAAIDASITTLRANGTLRGFGDMYFVGRRFTYVPPEGVPARPGYLSLAVSPDSPPFSFRNEHGDIVGLDIDVAGAVCDLLGVELKIIEYDSWELISAVRYGRADLALGWLPSEGEEQYINISEPYAVAEHVVLVRR